jgi:hypothetical protein
MIRSEGVEFVTIPLTRGHRAIVDVSDFAIVQPHCWCAYPSNHTVYAHANLGERNGKKTYKEMHVVIMQPKPGEYVDHINGNGLDNRRTNLRLCTQQQNCRNSRPHRDGTSRFKGVSWFKRDQCWRAYLVIDAKQKHLGYFADEVEAAKAYDAAAQINFGEFARLNFPDFQQQEG